MTDSLIDMPLKWGYDPAVGEDESALMIMRSNGNGTAKVLGTLFGEAADYVYHAMHQLDALLEEKRNNDND